MASRTMKDLGFVEDWEAGRKKAAPELDEDEESRAGVKRYYGKYRGTVLLNVDPLRQGRIQVQVPDVYGPNFSTWAMPCLPAGGLLGGMYVAPAVRTGVWVEFEQGDPDFPIWTGTWWGIGAELPSQAKLSTPGVAVITLESLGVNAVVISDTPIPPQLPAGGILLSAGPQSYIAIAKNGITIQGATLNINPTAAGAVTINPTGIAPVLINQNALAVT